MSTPGSPTLIPHLSLQARRLRYVLGFCDDLA